MQNKALSYHNNVNLKNMVIEEMKNHQKQDKFIKGTYGFYEYGIFKGCAIGCAISSINNALGKSHDTNSHSALNEELAIPLWLSKLADQFFECLPSDACDKFAIDFLESIPVGVDLEPIRIKLCIMLLKESIETIHDKEGILLPVKEEVLEVLQGSLSLYESALKTGAWNTEVSNDFIKKVEHVAMKASIHFPYNVSHLANVALQSVRTDSDAIHRMFFSSTIGSYDGKLPSEVIGNAYIGHANQLLELLKNSGDKNDNSH